jgi:CRISPR type III-A-associated RAMP protein Csm4
MKLKLIKLNFTSPLHLGSGKPDFYGKSETRLHSDTIKSAIFSTALLFDNSLGLEFFNSFKVSSAFPYSGDSLFFPVPDMPINELIEKFVINFDCEGSKRSDYDKGKIVKKIKYLDKTQYQKFINGEKINVEIREKNDEYQQLISGYLLSVFVKAKDFKISRNEVNQRVYVSRMAEILASEENNPKFSDPYYIDKIYFHKNAGLFFLINIDDNKYFEVIKKAIELLEDMGLGTDRNVGNGQFKASNEELDLEVPSESQLQTNLSLFVPEEDELEGIMQIEDIEDKMYYTLIERGGYISNFMDSHSGTLLKNPVMMFSEASVFPNLKLNGKTVDVTPEAMKSKHNVWRDGSSIFIPVKR